MYKNSTLFMSNALGTYRYGIRLFHEENYKDTGIVFAKYQVEFYTH